MNVCFHHIITQISGDLFYWVIKKHRLLLWIHLGIQILLWLTLGTRTLPLCSELAVCWLREFKASLGIQWGVSMSCVTFCPTVWKCCACFWRRRQERTMFDVKGYWWTFSEWSILIVRGRRWLWLMNQRVIMFLFLEVLSHKLPEELAWISVASGESCQCEKKSCLKPKGPPKGLSLAHRKQFNTI